MCAEKRDIVENWRAGVVFVLSIVATGGNLSLNCEINTWHFASILGINSISIIASPSPLKNNIKIMNFAGYMISIKKKKKIITILTESFRECTNIFYN